MTTDTTLMAPAVSLGWAKTSRNTLTDTGTGARAEVDSRGDACEAVVVSGRTFDVLSEPVTLARALASRDDRGRFSTVVAIETGTYLRGHACEPTLRRWLARQVVVEGQPYGLVHVLRAVTDDGAHALVEVTLDVGAILVEADAALAA